MANSRTFIRYWNSTRESRFLFSCGRCLFVSGERWKSNFSITENCDWKI